MLGDSDSDFKKSGDAGGEILGARRGRFRNGPFDLRVSVPPFNVSVLHPMGRQGREGKGKGRGIHHGIVDEERERRT